MTRRNGRYTERTNEIWDSARGLTKQFGNPYLIDPEHIWLALINEEKGIAGKVLREAGLQEDLLWELIKDYSPPDPTGPKMPFRDPISDWIHLYVEEANSRGHIYITTGHLLLALLKQEHETTQQILEYFRLDRTELSNALGLAFAKWADYSDHPMLARPMTLEECIVERFEIVVNWILWNLEKVLIAVSPKSTINFDKLAVADKIDVHTNSYGEPIKLITDSNDIAYTVEFLSRRTDGWHTYPFGPPVLQIYLHFYVADELIGVIGISWDILDRFPLYKDLKDHEGKQLFDRLDLNDYVKVRCPLPKQAPGASS